MGLLPRIEIDAVDVDMPPINITALNDPVSLVHIPISCLTNDSETHSSRIYWTIERANKESEEFFNVTSNRIEIAIFASKELVSEEWAAVSSTDTSVRSSEGWRVFEIDSGDIGDEVNSGNYDSPHLRHVSAPLAKEGISILYQSSYHADFLMVKETDFERTSEIFTQHGWNINATSNPSPRQSLSPYSSVPTTPVAPRTPATPISPSFPTPPPSNQPSPAYTSSSHLSAHELTALPSPLAVIGFHRSSSLFQLHTGLIQKYITWPNRCRAQYATPSYLHHYPESQMTTGHDDRPFISYTRTQDGASLITEVRVIRGMFSGLEEGMLCGEEIGDGWESEAESDLEVEETDRSGSETERGSDTEVDEPVMPATAAGLGVGRGEVNGSDDEEDEDDNDDDTPRAPWIGGQTMTPPPEYFSQAFRRPKRQVARPRAQHRKTQSVPTTPGIGLGAAFDFQPRGPRVHKRRSTVGVRLGGFDKDERGEKGERRKGRKRCIQLDMTEVGEVEDGMEAYHLDKSGLVTRFSTLLQQANIRMLYSSTFHTANILVEARDVRIARRLLAGVK